MKIFNSLLASLFILTIIACSPQIEQSTSYSIVGSWKLIGMQLDGTPGEQKIDSTLSQSDTRFVYEKTGQFKMVLNSDGRGLQGGYLYNPETNILSIRYGNQVDTALVNWVNVNRMVHTTTDGKTITILEREKTLKR